MRPLPLPQHFGAFTLSWKSNFFLHAGLPELETLASAWTALLESFTLTRLWDLNQLQTGCWQGRFNGSCLQESCQVSW